MPRKIYTTPALDTLAQASEQHKIRRNRVMTKARAEVDGDRMRMNELAAAAFRDGAPIAAIARAMGTKSWADARTAIRLGGATAEPYVQQDVSEVRADEEEAVSSTAVRLVTEDELPEGLTDEASVAERFASVYWPNFPGFDGPELLQGYLYFDQVEHLWRSATDDYAMTGHATDRQGPLSAALSELA